MMPINKKLVGSKKSIIAIFYLSVTIMLIITAYGAFNSAENYKDKKEIIIGDVLLDTEFPSGSVNLVTYLMIFSLISWFAAIKIFEDNLKSLPSYIQTILQIFSLVAIIISGYELFYNFTVWNSVIIDNLINGNFEPDQNLINYPKADTPWNLAFATQMFLAALIISCHCFYVITKSRIIGNNTEMNIKT